MPDLGESLSSSSEEKEFHLEKEDRNNDIEYPELSFFRYSTLLLFMSLAMVLNIFCTQCTMVAMEQIGSDLDIKTVNLQWLTTAYAIAFGAFLLLFGRIADIYGHKEVFLAGVAWMGIWSIGCGFVKNEIGLFIMRAFQGVGSSAFVPAAMGILGGTIAPGPRKSTAFATFSAGAPIGASMGFVFSGILTTWAPAGWRAIFYVTAGICALVFIGSYFAIPNTKTVVLEEHPTVDWIGAALITVGLLLFTFALAQGTGVNHGWHTAYIPALFSVGMVCIIAFWFWERYLEYHTNRPPLMLTSIWFRERFAIVQLLGAMGWASFSSYNFLSVLYYLDYEKRSPILTTIRFLPAPVTGFCLNVIFALVAAIVPAQVLFMLGAIGTALSSTLFAVQDLSAPYWQYQFPAMIVAVFGADFVFASGIMYVSRIAGPGQQALAGGVFNMTTQIGTAIGLAVCTIIQNDVTSSESLKLGVHYTINANNAPPYAVWKGLQMSFVGAAAFSCFCILLSTTCLYGIGRVGQKKTLVRVKKEPAAQDASETHNATS